jgi:hypothetical protein
MGKKSPPPKAPDLTPISNAQMAIAKETNEIARQQLGLSQQQFDFLSENAKEELALARQQADRLFEFQNKAFASDEEARKFAQQVGQSQIDAMNLQMDYAKRDRERYEKTFLPMQDRMIAEANAYDTPERREAEASRATVDIQRAAEAARANSDSRLRSMGLDPSQLRSATLLDTQNVATAAQQAAAANQARTSVEDRGRALRADAVNMGMGLPSQATQGFAGAGAAGQGALGAGQAGQAAQLGAISGGAGVGSTALGFRSQALGNLSNLTGSPMAWAGLGSNNLGAAGNAYGNAGNTMSSNFSNQMSSWKAGQEQSQQNFSNIMSVAGMAAGMMMAEGGPVRRAEGGPAVSRADFPLASALLGDVGGTGREASAAMARAPISRAPTGGPNITMGARLQAGVDNAAAHDPGNVWAEQDYMPQAPMQRQTPPVYAAEGGPQRARGALPRRQSRDMLPAYLAEGEYVIPADVVASKGIEFFDKMVSKYHRENA